MRVPKIMIALVLTLAATPALAKKKKKPVKTAAAPAAATQPGAGTTGMLTTEAAFRASKHVVTFKSASISADRKTPIGTILTAASAPKDHDFVRLRFRWRPEMLASADNLDNETERPSVRALPETGGEAPLGGSVETAERRALAAAHAAAETPDFSTLDAAASDAREAGPEP